MKLKLKHILILFLTNISYAQLKVIENVANFNTNDCGTVHTNSKSYYYTFHILEKKSKDTIENGVLTIFNEDLTEHKNIKFDIESHIHFLEVKNNNTSLIVAFADEKKYTIDFKIFSLDGELLKSKEITYNKLLFSPSSYKSFMEPSGDFQLIYPVENKGYMITEIIKKKRRGYNLYYLDIDGKDWSYESPSDHNNRKTIAPMYSNEEVVILMEKEWGSNFDQQPTFKAIIVDTKNGKELFSVSHDYETKQNFYTKAIVSKKGDILLFGELYDDDNNYPDDNYNIGYFIEQYSKSGQLIKETSVRYENNAFKKSLGIDDDAKQKDFGIIHFYDFLETNNTLYAIGQMAKREKKGASVFKILTSSVIGGAIGGLISNNWKTTYTLSDMVIVEFDENLNFVNSQKLQKNETYTGLNTMSVRPQFNLLEMQAQGKLDFIYKQLNQNREMDFFLISDKKIENESLDFKIKKASLINNSFQVETFSNLDLLGMDNFKILPKSRTSSLLITQNIGAKTIIFKVLENK
ncbi:hypothetical protein IU405_01580 [Polaribacter sp. BAL334]|uniref:DUF6770 family protein n=1 Tax=Polaribacter sp. BAL334 TaxID=1708178 RepID=UPI0018D2538C|nr:DUF6770 family protein [Polaribacter sp. BAL334]MBG7610938.1 hypothetical protein [Polaribacter sp. BAL334]